MQTKSHPGLQRVLVLGGYGAFGGRVAERLAQVPGVEVVIAGRSQDRGLDAALELEIATGKPVTARRLDAASVTPADLTAIGAGVVINASGPYQSQDYRLARACIAARVHYLDLADARLFVTGIRALDAEARAAGVLIVSGASTVPAVSGAVADAHAAQFGSLSAIASVIAPGNNFDPGLATTRSILMSLGRPIANGAGRAPIFGWQGLDRRRLPGLGARWIGHCDAPDRDLFPQRYAGLKVADVYAALEVGPFHLGLWGLAGLARSGLLPHPELMARPLLATKRRLGFLGSDRGGMLVSMAGTGRNGEPKHIDWHLIACGGHGPYIPATPSVLLAKRLVDGTLQKRGAMPCVGLFTLSEFLAETADLDLTTGTQ
ncbi:MAG: saccharopine dehydrogenase NADP-binding domain-containing protein [Hyphomonadaceae bacterium]|nr:saccharopine dehydrogenase NADP-binding domain-containing protein [Hyphomonadaceae bacterium]